MDNPIIVPVLEADELRVLGALMEKSKTTPDYYPMTLNALTAACNQKTSRRPVVNYDDDTVMKCLDTLKRRGLVSTATGGSSRVTKYKHNFAIVFPVVPAEVAVICLLLLRGPQTPGELNTNSGRLYEFESLDDVNAVLDRLSSPEMPFLKQLERRPGQKEVRYVHLMGSVLDVADNEEDTIPYRPTSDLEERLAKVETELAEVKEKLESLLKELGA